MQMNDSQRIPASKEKVWAALNDPAVLKQCIPGCQSLEMSTPTEMTATVVFRVGPVKATFGGKVTLSDLDPPNSYRISGEGSGGVAGFAKGGATIRLEAESPDVTILHYEVDAQIGGKLAQLGQAADRFNGQETRRRVLCGFRGGGRRNCGGAGPSGCRAEGLAGQADGLANQQVYGRFSLVGDVRVKVRPQLANDRCPFVLQQQTLITATAWSASCQNETQERRPSSGNSSISDGSAS
jgi:uncharacterized protein